MTPKVRTMTASEAASLRALTTAGASEVWDVTAVPDSADAEFAGYLSALAEEAAGDGDSLFAAYLTEAADWHAGEDQ
jgi:hypothetical protein